MVSRRITKVVKPKHVLSTFFLIVAIVFLSSIVISSLMKPNLAPRVLTPTCITPSAYPQVITQSGTICPGNYNFGIGVGADNVKVVCRPGTTFNGLTWNGSNGLTIQGRRNVTIEECHFNSFNKNGIYVGNVTNYTSEINLIRINSSSNNENGVFIGHKVVNIRINQSEITNNNQDGLLFKTNYFGEINSNALLFPRGVYLSENKILQNHQNGINFDAYDYHTYTTTSSIYQPIALNNSIQVLGNIIRSNYKNGIQSVGLDTGIYAQIGIPYRTPGYFIILNNFIDLNGFNLNGSGIALIINKSDGIISNVSGSYMKIGLDYIANNDIKNNSIDGISIDAPDLSSSFSNFRYLEYGAAAVYANYISFNGRHGISTIADLTNMNYLAGTSLINQNALINNGDTGIYMVGLNDDMFSGSYMRSQQYCNDIVLSGNGNKNGVEIGDVDETFLASSKNIIEGNNVGISAEDMWITSWIWDNYIGNNSIGIIINQNQTNYNRTDIRQNDFNQSGLQVLDIPSNAFIHNWWSDYSPTCVDTNPQNGWCDVPRPIPISSQDLEPKAGSASFGNKNRGYLVKANTGVLPKPSCTFQGYPTNYPIITIPNFPGPSPEPVNN